MSDAARLAGVAGPRSRRLTRYIQNRRATAAELPLPKRVYAHGWLLFDTGRDPGFLVGGELLNFGRGYRLVFNTGSGAGQTVFQHHHRAET